MELLLINPKSLPLEDKMKIAGALPDQLSISDIAKICYPDDLNARNLLSKEIIALCKSKELPYYGDINGWEWGSVLYDDSIINIGLSKNPFPEIIGTPISSGDSMRDLRFNGNKFRANAGNCLINKCDFKKYLDDNTILSIGNLLNWFNDAEQQSKTVDEAKGKRRRDLQLDEIQSVATKLQYKDLMAIPEGGKAAIKKECLKNPALFTDAAFKKAWQEANKRNLISMQDKEKYL